MNDNMNLNDIKILGKYAIEDVEVKELKEGKAYGFFNRVSEEQIFPETWAMAFPFSAAGYAIVKKDDLWGIIDFMGQNVVPCRWKEIEEGGDVFPNGLCGVMDDYDHWGFIDSRGSMKLPCRWTAVSGFSEGICAVCDDFNIWTFVDPTGRTVYSSDWKNVLSWSEGLLPVQNQDGLWGFVNSHNEECIPCQWEEVSSFSDGLCSVKTKENRWGAIDKNGELVIPAEWDDMFSFENGEAYVMKNGQAMVIDKQGNVKENIIQKVPVSYSLEPEPPRISQESQETSDEPYEAQDDDDSDNKTISMPQIRGIGEWLSDGWNNLDGKWGNAVLLTIVFLVCLIGDYLLETGANLVIAAIYAVTNDMATPTTGLTLELFSWPISVLSAIFIFYPLTYGIMNSFVKAKRSNSPVAVGGVFLAKEQYLVVVNIGALYYLYIFLWSLLFIIPGIYKSLCYSMCFYIRHDHPELPADACIELSEEMMDGHKTDLFVILLLFSIVIVLSICTCCIGFLFSIPYMCSVMAEFYEDVKADYEYKQYLLYS